MREYIITIEDWFFRYAHERYTHFFGCPIEEIVRCRDCVFFIADVETVDEHGEQIATGNLCEWTELWVEPCGFCSWAERRNA